MKTEYSTIWGGAYCADCGLFQPEPNEVHLVTCPQHNENNCLACKELEAEDKNHE